MTTALTIAILKGLFAACVVPISLLSDNGTQFTATKFKTFLQISSVMYKKAYSPIPSGNERTNWTIHPDSQGCSYHNVNYTWLIATEPQWLLEAVLKDSTHNHRTNTTWHFLWCNLHTQLDLLGLIMCIRRLQKSNKLNLITCSIPGNLQKGSTFLHETCTWIHGSQAQLSCT